MPASCSTVSLGLQLAVQGLQPVPISSVTNPSGSHNTAVGVASILHSINVDWLMQDCRVSVNNNLSHRQYLTVAVLLSSSRCTTTTQPQVRVAVQCERLELATLGLMLLVMLSLPGTPSCKTTLAL